MTGARIFVRASVAWSAPRGLKVARHVGAANQVLPNRPAVPPPSKMRAQVAALMCAAPKRFDGRQAPAQHRGRRASACSAPSGVGFDAVGQLVAHGLEIALSPLLARACPSAGPGARFASPRRRPRSSSSVRLRQARAPPR